MKQAKSILIILFGLGFYLSANAQSVITGSNLNIGAYNTLSGTPPRGNAIGENHWLEGLSSLAVGKNDTILEVSTGSMALGADNRIRGNGSMAIGNGIKIQGMCNIGIGNEIKATAVSRCMLIGNGLLGTSIKPDMFLENNFENSLMIGFKSIHPTLTVGPSPNDYPTGDTLGKTGKVAIGDVPIPDIAAKLHIRSDYGEDAGILLESKDPSTANTFIRLRDEGHGIEVDSDGVMRLRSMDGSNMKPILLNGVVGINVSDQDIVTMEQQHYYSLYAKGGIITTKVSIKRYESWWSDYVFDPNYELMSLGDLRRYINTNRHLPDIPSEAEVMEEGVELGIMQSLLLKKIEELTLYTLQLQEQVESMQMEIDHLKNK